MSEIIQYIKSQDETQQNAIEELQHYSSLSIVNQAEVGKELTVKLVVYNKAIQMMGDEIFDLGMENEALKEQLGEFDKQIVEETKNRIKLEYDTDKQHKFILDKMRRQCQKHLNQLK